MVALQDSTTAVHQLRRYLREAEQAVDARQRLDLLTQHVLDVWLWTLAQVICSGPSPPHSDHSVLAPLTAHMCHREA